MRNARSISNLSEITAPPLNTIHRSHSENILGKGKLASGEARINPTLEQILENVSYRFLKIKIRSLYGTLEYKHTRTNDKIQHLLLKSTIFTQETNNEINYLTQNLPPIFPEDPENLNDVIQELREKSVEVEEDCNQQVEILEAKKARLAEFLASVRNVFYSR